MKILVPYDGSEEARAALSFAIRTHKDADIVVLHVTDIVGKGGGKEPKAAWWNMWQDDRERIANELLEEARGIATDEGREVTTVRRTGKPSTEILGYADEEGIDVVVMGRQGQTGLRRSLLGSAADRVARYSDVPVTLVGGAD